MAYNIDFGAVNPFTGPLAFTSGWLMGHKSSQAQQGAIDYQDRQQMWSGIGQGVGGFAQGFAYPLAQSAMNQNRLDQNLDYEKQLLPMQVGAANQMAMGRYAGGMGMTPEQLRQTGTAFMENLGPEQKEQYSQAYLGMPYNQFQGMKDSNPDAYSALALNAYRAHNMQLQSQFQHPQMYPYQNAALPGGPMAAGASPMQQASQPGPGANLPFGDDMTGKVAAGLTAGTFQSSNPSMQNKWLQLQREYTQQRAPYQTDVPGVDPMDDAYNQQRLGDIDQQYVPRFRALAAEMAPTAVPTQKPNPFRVMTEKQSDGSWLTMGGVKHYPATKQIDPNRLAQGAPPEQLPDGRWKTVDQHGATHITGKSDREEIADFGHKFGISDPIKATRAYQAVGDFLKGKEVTNEGESPSMPMDSPGIIDAVERMANLRNEHHGNPQGFYTAAMSMIGEASKHGKEDMLHLEPIDVENLQKEVKKQAATMKMIGILGGGQRQAQQPPSAPPPQAATPPAQQAQGPIMPMATQQQLAGSAAAGLNIMPGSIPEHPAAMPDAKREMQDGLYYMTPRGPKKWNASKSDGKGGKGAFD